MGVRDEKLWSILEAKATEEDEGLRPEQQFCCEYIAGAQMICKFGVDRAKTIRDTFPMFTLHDETHICNVMRLTVSLLGERAAELSRDEAAMLILAACCHDIGMSCSEEDKKELLLDLDRLNQYLDCHHSEYVKAYAGGGDEPEMTDGMIQDYLRSIHHERAAELLCGLEWPDVLKGRVDCEDLIRVCQSHGEEIGLLGELESTPAVDLRLCAVLLRLADILDFDTSRAPAAVYDYSGFRQKSDSNSLRSKAEWDKHMASQGFDFAHVSADDRLYPYSLPYSAVSRTMQVEQTVNSYLDWVDRELDQCGKEIRRFSGKWRELVLPGKIKRNIKAEGYVSGQYRLTMDQDQIMELLVGRDLYSDPAVFVRELLQNAIDAVRTREQLDRNLPRDFKPQIRIRTWIDEEGYHWFRIEDNGIGMTEETIRNYFLKIGRSYYNSDAFREEKLRCRADPDYTPISRFGIGILSCFMGDERSNRVEVSTKHFTEGKTYYPALRLSMHGTSGYYYLASKEKNHIPGPMRGCTAEEKEPYLKRAGTVIAVRTNLYQTGTYRGFKEIVDRYVVYPQVPIHYDGPDGTCDYPTEQEFMDAMHAICPSEDLRKNGLMEFPLSEAQLEEIRRDRPEIVFTETPKVLLKCFPLDRYTQSPYLTGAVVAVAAAGKAEEIIVSLGERQVSAAVRLSVRVDKENIVSLVISLGFPSMLEIEMEAVEEGYRNLLFSMIGLIGEDTNRVVVFYKELVDGLNTSEIDSSIWRNHITEKYNISPIDFEIIINEVKSRVKVYGDFYSQQTVEAWYRLKDEVKEWRYELCELSGFEWFEKYFRNKNIVAHNGIYAGEEFLFPMKISRNQKGILLLRDKYRPSVDIARDCIRGITFEMACELAIMFNTMKCSSIDMLEDRDFRERNTVFENESYSSLPVNQFWRVLEQRQDLKEKLVIQTAGKKFTLKELGLWIQEQQELKLEGVLFWGRMGAQFTFQDNDLYNLLCLAGIQKEFGVKFSYKSVSGIAFYLSKKSSALFEDVQGRFPVAFFATPHEEETPWFTKRKHGERYTCNANHRFSIWLRKNCEELNHHVPGLYKEMFRIVSQEDDLELISGINDLLLRIRSLPGTPISVPDNVFLKEEDLC